ncbi:hypothetical protein [Streptomyces cellostaticus]|uniref:hypothetical protein n=1 Tax=Streptomyces cellostaticus TaxID=67285 RepID=UPI000AE2DA55|nr:hypothetical protein [Streptomyces cellostaticus]GHI04185.1 hypothetical protein Scel_25060 [Streptomyces cellostaticus]
MAWRAGAEEITGCWKALAAGATIGEPLGPCCVLTLYGKLTGRFDVTRVLDVIRQCIG